MCAFQVETYENTEVRNHDIHYNEMKFYRIDESQGAKI